MLALSAGVRLWGLGSPGEYIFDEVYYAKDGRAVLDGRVGPAADQASWEPGDVVSWPHPDAGRFAIAAGIALLGDRPVGWRLSPALAGLALLACVYPLARRLGLSQGWALGALALAAADTLGIAQSRIATLDVFVALWTGVAVLCALHYAQEGRRPVWLLLAGLAGGLAVASKWSGALALLAAVMIVALPARVWRPGGETAPRPRGRFGAVLLAVACLVLLPALVYVASYAQYFAAGHGLADWRELQRQMWHFNLNLSAPHSYASAAPTWILDYRPVWYSFTDVGGRYFGVVAMGNPFLWWAATGALLVAPVAALTRRAAGLVGPALLVAALYFPWFAATRTSFLYYMTPVAPFLAILVAAALAAIAGAGAAGGRAAGSSLSAPGDGAPPDLCESDARPAAGRDGAVPRSGRVPAVAVTAAAFACAALWQPLAQILRSLVWDLPGRVAPGLALATVAAVFVAGVVLARLAVRHAGRHGCRHWAACAMLGAITGIAVAFLPIVLNIGISPERFYELIWFPSWI